MRQQDASQNEDMALSPVLLSKNTNMALKEVMKSIKTLEGVYEKENNALKSMNTKGFVALQDDKLDAARHYQNIMGQMLSRKDEIAQADPKLKERMKDAYAEFKSISRENMASIERMQRCTERLGDTIRNAAIRSAQTQRSYIYGENGALSNSTQNKAVSSGLSETV
ncbi:MAG: hypothetical protein ACRBDI_02810 [Alphaproteobacteria bacterium]